ncbi:non-ribosomal peptide synthetase [Argonema galeatum]|uniref:non-ribosomal peptide synthetase n=1 Tax=Argonema galeatum TaxID=2942762 RepID=UPI002013B0D3|nr:non-ribosomal peptide synthetase [Argonema galeatum]MCL1465995.1 amino acid adenylation domain-containing protein [Argonema galeatum A003/A1]
MTKNIAENCLKADDKKLNIEQEAEVFVFPASFAQQRLWFFDRLAPGNPFYNVSTAVRLKGCLNLTALEQTFNEIVRRHETLRTTFVMVEGQPVQAIAPSLTIPLPVINLQNRSLTEQETETRRLTIHEAKHPFNLAEGPLLRVTLLQLSEKEYVLLLNLHHIVADGWSIGVLIKELGILYTAFVKKQLSPLPELPLQYADFAEWQRQWLQGEVLETQLAYWRQHLNGITILNLPTNRPRPAIQTYRGTKQFLTISPFLSKALESLNQQENVTLFMTLLAAFQTLLYRYTGQEDIAVGSPIANRNLSEIEALIGFFVNSLVLRTDLSGNPTFRELLSRVKEVAMGAYAHQDLPFEKLVEVLHPERDLSRNPLFQVSFSLQNTPVEALYLPELTLSLLEVDTGTAKLDLEFHLWSDLESLKVQVVYSTDLFDDTTITRMLGHFQTLLESIVANPEYRVSELPILAEAERHQLLVEFSHNQSKIPSPKSKIEQCFHQLFEAQVEESPDAIALVFENQQLTYRELNIRANQLAHHLQQLGVVPDVLVGICLERSLDMIVGLLSILKAGGAYLPLDPTYPQERLNFMLEDAQVSILLTHSLKKGGWGDIQDGLSIVYLDKDWDIIAQQSQFNPISNLTPANLAYAIYTSGSTGKPKGVLLLHQGLFNLAEAQIDIFNVQPSSRILQFASLSFDASIFEIVMALGTGATLYLAKKESLLPGQSLIKLLRDNAISHITLPPAVLSVLPKEELPALQTIICAGESCSQDIVKHWACDRRFFNAYGPTEVTVWATIAEIKDDSEKPPIGRPILNTQVYILDKNLQPVPIGITGELYISGDGVGKGYLNRPHLTAEQFIPLSETGFLEETQETRFLGETGFLEVAKLYKTGDLARYRQDGNIEFLGRIDEQVKIRGFRIELGEIEAVLSQHPAVREAVAVSDIALEEASGNKRLVAYIVPEQNLTPTIVELRNFLKTKLPEYTIPSVFVVLDSLPLTPNGKVDRRALPALLNLKFPSNLQLNVAPRTPIESTIAKIWAEVLNLELVGIHDNFFYLGGDSLLAIRLMDAIEKQFNRELPLSALFLNPTIEGLASILATQTNSLPWSPLVPIQPKGSKPPFFCVHPVFGVVFPYYELAYNLGEDRPFYGLQPLGIDGENPPLNGIEDMATYYIDELRTVQPIGPYFLGGWSFGGLVAFEMAQQLQKSGQQVALLAVLDTLAPVPSNKVSFWHGLKFLLTTATRYIWPFLMDYFYLVAYPNRQKSQNIPQESRRRILKELTSKSILKVFQANSEAAVNYVPQIYPNRITLLRSSDRSIVASQDPTMGWNELAGSGVEVHVVSGNHLTMLRKPNVQALAEQLKVCFDKVQGN